MAAAFAHVVGHLTDVILYLAPLAADGRDGPEPVHQMRVAVRRLRSAIKVFRHAVRCPAVDAADADLKALAGRLAPTRDWDVFVTETGAAAGSAFPTEEKLGRLLAAAERRRIACHADLRAYLRGADFRRLGIELACLAGSEAWQATLGEAETAELATPLTRLRPACAEPQVEAADAARRRHRRTGAGRASCNTAACQAAALCGGDLFPALPGKIDDEVHSPARHPAGSARRH